MALERKEKLISLPLDVWSTLEKDAERCRRSVTKQIEAILVAYFAMEDVNVKDMEDVQAAVSPTGKRKTEMLQGGKEIPRQKRKNQ